MKTVIYGRSDDLIEIEGPLNLEVMIPHGVKANLMFSDGTFVQMEYSPRFEPEREGIWRVAAIKRGHLYEEAFRATSAGGDDYSDRVTLGEGVTRVTVSYPGFDRTYYVKENA